FRVARQPHIGEELRDQRGEIAAQQQLTGQRQRFLGRVLVAVLRHYGPARFANMSRISPSNSSDFGGGAAGAASCCQRSMFSSFTSQNTANATMANWMMALTKRPMFSVTAPAAF